LTNTFFSGGKNHKLVVTFNFEYSIFWGEHLLDISPTQAIFLTLGLGRHLSIERLPELVKIEGFLLSVDFLQKE